MTKASHWIAGLCTTILTVLGTHGASAQSRWQSFNTCWRDFDVNGGVFCGVSMPECSGVPQGLMCKTSVGLDYPPLYTPQPPDADRIVAVTVTE